MIVWIAHAKVGHRQTPYKQNAPAVLQQGRFAFLCTYAEQVAILSPMTTESELKLRVKAEHFEQLKRELRPYQITKPVTRRLHNVYFDTPALDLHNRKMALRLRRVGGKWLQTLKGGGSVVAGLHRRDEEEIEVPDGRLDLVSLKEALPDEVFLPCIRENLQPLFATDFHRTSYTIDWQGASIEVCLDRGEVRMNEQFEPINEVEMELVSGESVKLFELAFSLLDTLPFELEMVSKADKGFRLVTNFVPKPVKAEMPRETGELSVGLQASIWSSLMHLQGNLHGAIEGKDPEFLHQMRVALRRLRVLLRICEKMHADITLSALRAFAASLAARMGQLREWDVFIAQIRASNLGASGKRAMSAYAESRRRDIFAGLPFIDIQRLLLRFAIWMDGEYWDSARQCEQPISKFASRYLQKLHRRYQHARRQRNDIDQLHVLRIEAKKLRYGSELFSGLYEARRVRKYLEALGQVQDALGEIHDIVVAKRLIGEMILPRRKKTLTDFEIEMDLLLSKKLKAFKRLVSAFDRMPVFWK